MDPARASGPRWGGETRRDPVTLEQALQAARVGENESAWSWVGDDGSEGDDRARVHTERVERRVADYELHTRLALAGFAGAEYEEFRTELTRYGLDVMIGWLRTGKIFPKMREAGYGLPGAPTGSLDRDAQDELAYETVATALDHFHHRVLLRGGWDPRRGARLTTFFIGQCKIRFANIYRTWLDKEVRTALPVAPEHYELLHANHAPVLAESPEWRAVARGYIRRGMRAVNDPRLHRAMELIAADNTQAEIAEDLDITEKAVERMLANNRDRIRKLGIA